MKVQLAPKLIQHLKKQDVRIRKSFQITIKLFSKDPYNPHLNNHALRRKWAGFRSINITSNWRAIYKVVDEGEEVYAYFVTLGTHKQLYRTN